MDGIKEKLEAAGYDTSHISETDILSQLDKAGYDTSPLKQTYQQHVNEVMKGITSEPGVQNISLTPITKPDIEQAGEDVATKMAQSRIPGVSNPYVAATAGTLVSKAPDIAMAAGGLEGLGAAREAAQAGELGQIGRIVSGPSRQEAGAAIGQAEKAVGIDTSRVPTLKDAATQLGAWKANPAQYLNALTERLNSGIPLSAEDLSLQHKQLTDMLSQEPSKLAKLLGQGSKLGANGVATAAQADSQIVEQLNQAAPGRANAAADYAASKARETLYKTLAASGAAVLGKNAISEAFKRVTGGH